MKFEAQFVLAEAIGVAEAAKYLRGRRGGQPNPRTVRRWTTPGLGCRCYDGSTVILRSVKVNGDILTMREWVEDFQRRVLLANERSQQSPPHVRRVRSPRARQAAHKAAEAHLDSVGVA